MVRTFDTLLITFMQTAQLTFNGQKVTEFFAVLFPKPAEISAIRNLLGSFSLFFRGTFVLKMGVAVGQHYTVAKISAISYLFVFFFYFFF